MARREIGRRCPGAEVRTFAPFGHLHPVRSDGGDPAEPLGIWSPARVSELAGLADCVVVTGELMLEDERLAALYGITTDEARASGLSRFLVEGLGAELERDCPVLWQSVAVTDSLDATNAARLRAALAERRLVTVRDEGSRARLERAGVERDVAIVPDPTLLLPRLLPAALLRRRLAYLRLMGWYPADDAAVVVEASAQLLPSAAALATALLDLAADHRDRLAVVVVELAPYEGGDDFADALHLALGRDVHRMPAVVGGEDVVAAIAASAGFIGTSAYGATTAAGYGRPHAILDPAEVVPEAVADGYRQSTSASAVSSLADQTAALDHHFDRVVEIGGGAARRRVPSIGSPAYPDGVEQRLEAMHRAHGVRGERLAAERATFADRVVDLETDIARLHEEAGHLQRWGDRHAAGREVAEREVAALRETRTFRWTAAAREVYTRLRTIARRP